MIGIAMTSPSPDYLAGFAAAREMAAHPATPQTGNEDYENRPGYLRQIADEIDAEAEVSPCTEASIIREAAEEIERLRTTLDEAEQALTFYRKMRATPPKKGES